MFVALEELEAQYRDHVIGYAPLSGQPLDEIAAIARLQAAFSDAVALASGIERMFDQRVQEKASLIAGVRQKPL